MSLFRVLNSALQHVSGVTNFTSKYFQSLVHILTSLDTVGFAICTILYCDPNHASLPRCVSLCAVRLLLLSSLESLLIAVLE